MPYPADRRLDGGRRDVRLPQDKAIRAVKVDIHSHFFPIDAFRNSKKFPDSAPRIVMENGRPSVATGAGARGNLAEGAYDAAARIKDLDAMGIDLQAISPSPVLLFYRDPPDAAAYFSRLQNEAIQKTVEMHPDRFVGFGTAPLQDVPEAIRVAEEAKGFKMRYFPVASLTITATSHPELSEVIANNILTVNGTPGTYAYLAYATDGQELTPSNIFTITIPGIAGTGTAVNQSNAST